MPKTGADGPRSTKFPDSRSAERWAGRRIRPPFFLLGQQLRRKRCIGTHAGHADGYGQRCNGLRLAPLEKGQEHIGSHQQIQLILRIAFPQFAQRIHGIARAGPVKLDAADLHAGFSSYGKLREREARFAVRRAFGHGLVRRDGCRDQENFVQSQQLPRLARGENMPQMRRIEAAAVNADPCHAAPLPCRCSFYCSSFCWRLRSMAAETALSWKYCLRCFRCCSAACLRARSPALTGL